MSGKIRKIIIFFTVFLAVIAVFLVIFYGKKNEINRVLKSEEYAYLPLEAQKYIKEVYEDTGEIILTEKNKEENKLYLNPQYVEYLTYTDEEKENIDEIPVSMIIDYSVREETKNIDVPSEYDLRDNYVTPVRDQGGLGLCWAFATAGAAESYLLKNDPSITITSPVLISERQMDYVTAIDGIKDYKSEYVSFVSRSLGDGGNFYISTIAMANGVSLFNYNSFKSYNDKDFLKMELSDVISYAKSEYEVNSTINFPRMSLRESTMELTDYEIETRTSYLNEIKQNIMENGAAYVSTYMSSSCQYTDSNLNNVVIDIYNCSLSDSHAMQIVGWDDNLTYSYCADTTSHSADVTNCNRVVSGKGVWILKNSWGENLKYPYLTYDSLYSSISFIDDMTSTSARTWNNNYVLGDGSENVNKKTYYLTDTKIKDNEKIEKIKFIATNPDTIYNVEVYKKDGTYETFSKTTGLPGLITIDITNDIVVDKDTKIIIKSDGTYIDKISVFTSNIDTTPYIDLDEYNNISISETQLRMYSETKNIPSDTELSYKLYNSENEEITDNFAFSNSIVAENNINASLNFSSELESGDYRIDVVYNSNVISSINIKIVKMAGQGTEDDPYIITNPTQLSQIRDELDAYYELGNDIDLDEDTSEGGKLSLLGDICPQGFGWESINGFSGTLDGKGHTIKGLHQNNYITCDIEQETWVEWSNNGNGLFGTTSGNVTIKNLVLEDFDINCQGEDCGVLLSKYSNDLSDTTEYNATFENIALKNSEVIGVYNKHTSKYPSGGGLFGYIFSVYGDVSISNIYLDFVHVSDNILYNGYLAGKVQANKIDIQNIQLNGNADSTYDSGLLANYIINEELSSTKNILSTVTSESNTGGILFYHGSTNSIINGVNALKMEEKGLCNSFCPEDIANVNIFDKETELNKLTDKTYYSTWENFDDNWIIETIDGIPRIPVLKFVDFEYTSIQDISIKQNLNEHKSIYDYIMPNIDSAKRISYKSKNEEIVKIDENGIIIPQSTGNTTIHIESYYDGYIKDVPISIEYVPHYTIHFDANGGTGTMDSIEVEAGKEYTLPQNKFTKNYYELKEWNTKSDGTGTSYADLDTITPMNDKEEITLYAIWWGEERIVTFDANGGTVNPDKKVVRIGGMYGELPIPTKEGYGFNRWGGYYYWVDAFTQIIELELTADWIEDAYTIIYDANGGTIQSDYINTTEVHLISESIATTYALNGQDKVIYENLYENHGYKFKEWNTEKDGTGTSYSVDQVIQLSNVENDTLRLYAIWEEQKYSVTFDANEGAFTDNKTTLVVEEWDDTKLNSLEKPTREGYVFKGFFTEKTGGTSLESYIAESGIDQDGLIFYAQWEKIKYTLKFDANGGTGTMDDQIFTYDTLQTITKNAYTKTGYKFKEWNTKKDGTGTSYNDEKEIKLSKNLTFYAIWEQTYSYIINKYSFDDNKKYIDNVDINTTVNDFKKNIDLNDGYSVDVNYKTIDGQNLLYTGSKTKIYNNGNLIIEYTNIIRGEVTGDGKINYLDYVNVYNHIQKIKHPESTKKELKNEYLISADISDDGKVNYLDYVRIYNKIKELKGGTN